MVADYERGSPQWTAPRAPPGDRATGRRPPARRVGRGRRGGRAREAARYEAEPSADRVAGEAQAEALDEPRDGVGPHLELVPHAQLSQRLLAGLEHAAHGDE